jgi:hypothetical protein
MESFNVILASVGTPLRHKINRDFDAILKEPSIREGMLVNGFQPFGGSVEDASRFLPEDERVSRKLMRELKLKVE